MPGEGTGRKPRHRYRDAAVPAAVNATRREAPGAVHSTGPSGSCAGRFGTDVRGADHRAALGVSRTAVNAARFGAGVDGAHDGAGAAFDDATDVTDSGDDADDGRRVRGARMGTVRLTVNLPRRSRMRPSTDDGARTGWPPDDANGGARAGPSLGVAAATVAGASDRFGGARAAAIRVRPEARAGRGPCNDQRRAAGRSDDWSGDGERGKCAAATARRGIDE